MSVKWRGRKSYAIAFKDPSAISNRFHETFFLFTRNIRNYTCCKKLTKRLLERNEYRGRNVCTESLATRKNSVSPNSRKVSSKPFVYEIFSRAESRLRDAPARERRRRWVTQAENSSKTRLREQNNRGSPSSAETRDKRRVRERLVTPCGLCATERWTGLGRDVCIYMKPPESSFLKVVVW